MQSPIIAVSEKVMSMSKSMVFLAMRVGCKRGATTRDIVSFLDRRAPGQQQLFHCGIIERVLWQLQTDGQVTRAGSRWYLKG